MKRAAFLHCANADAERYKVLDRRDQTPFIDHPEKNEFTLHHAFRQRLALDLMGGEAKDKAQLQGLNPDYASKIVVNVCRFTWPLADDESLEAIAAGNLWAGVVVFDYVAPDEDNLPPEAVIEGSYRWSDWFIGELDELPSFIEKKKREAGGPGRKDTVRIFIADASACARGVLRRAEELGVA
ncbi:hypothetical protein [Mangrovicoccus ximenensis]|uniref:hypothetical protein n=1 Tax=Mangrovicoccus ximenensis TaxID=1911570 RepID=UPI000D3915B6|nr:hypothetical protein [Mangrovicoccus ximenensis]